MTGHLRCERWVILQVGSCVTLFHTSEAAASINFQLCVCKGIYQQSIDGRVTRALFKGTYKGDTQAVPSQSPYDMWPLDESYVPAIDTGQVLLIYLSFNIFRFSI